jgi:hypothetical protein
MAANIHLQEQQLRAKKRGQMAIKNYGALMAGEY